MTQIQLLAMFNKVFSYIFSSFPRCASIWFIYIAEERIMCNNRIVHEMLCISGFVNGGVRFTQTHRELWTEKKSPFSYASNWCIHMELSLGNGC